MPAAQLQPRVDAGARKLLEKSPVALEATKDAVRRVGEMTYDNADGRNYVLEFNIIDPNHPTNRVQAGVAVYELGANGLIKEARIYDEAW